MQYTTDAVHPKAKSASALQWAHSSLSRILCPESFLANTAGAPAALSLVGGSPQTTFTNTAFGTPLRVLVRDLGGNNVFGATVTFTVTAGGCLFGGLTTATAITSNVTGIAIAPTLTGGPLPNTCVVQATSGTALLPISSLSVTLPGSAL